MNSPFGGTWDCHYVGLSLDWYVKVPFLVEAWRSSAGQILEEAGNYSENLLLALKSEQLLSSS